MGNAQLIAGNHREAPYPTAGVDILSGAGHVSGDRTSEQRSATLIKAQIGLGRVRLDLLTQEMAEAILGPGSLGTCVTPILIADTAKAKHAKSIKNMGLNVLSNRQNGAAQHEGIPAFRPALIACRKVKMMAGRKSMDSKEH